MTVLTKDELEEKLEELENYRGRQTELISVYISAGYDVNAVQRQLSGETSTAKNIKSTSTRKNVIEALEKIIRELKGMKKTPENGLALFAGNISKIEGQADMRIWLIEPPMPLKIRLYRCDKEFVLEPLKEQLEVSEIYGLLVMDRKEATIGALEGKRIELLQKMTSGIPSKVRAGGQCLSPDTLIMKDDGEITLEKIHEGDLIKSFNFSKNSLIDTKVIKKWKVNKKKIFEIISIRGKIVASADHTFFVYEKGKIVEKTANRLKEKDNLVYKDGNKEEILSINEENKDCGLIDLEVENHNFLANGLIVHNSSQRFHRITEGLTKEFYKRIADEMKKIFYDNPKLKGILIGGPIPTKDEFIDNEYLATKLREKIIGRIDIGGSDESGLKELVEKSQEILAGQEIVHEKKILERFFKTLGEKPDLSTLKEPDTKTALSYGAVDTLILSKNLSKDKIKELKSLAENIGSTIEIVSTETEEGEQFDNLGGIGAILRFKAINK